MNVFDFCVENFEVVEFEGEHDEYEPYDHDYWGVGICVGHLGDVVLEVDVVVVEHGVDDEAEVVG